jgi:Flp pilus assembly protein TadD
MFLAIARFQQGRINEAQSLIEDVLRQSPQFDAAQPLLAWCLAARGQADAARALITERVRETAKADHEVAFWLGCFNVAQGLRDEAMEWLRRSVFLGNEDYVLFRDCPMLAPMRDHSAFAELVGGLKARWERRIAAGTPPSP